MKGVALLIINMFTMRLKMEVQVFQNICKSFQTKPCQLMYMKNTFCICVNLYTEAWGQLKLSISRLSSWPILKNVTWLGSRYISRRGFWMFKIIAQISWSLFWLTKTKQKKSKSCPTGVTKSVDRRSLFCPSPHSFVISATFVKMSK